MGGRLDGWKQRPPSVPSQVAGTAGARQAIAGSGNRVLARLLLQRGSEQAGEASLAERLQASRAGGQSLPADVADKLAPHVGPVTGSIRVHADSNADVLAREVNSVAFTTGRDIFFRSGSYQPQTTNGLRLLAHEATHVAQQAAGPVSGTSIGGGLSVSDPGDRFEREASAVARQLND